MAIHLLLFAGVLSSEEIFAPFVSGLSTKVQDNKILLSWRAAPAAIDAYVIFRSDTPIDSSSFNRAVELATVEGTQLNYTDTPPDTSGYFYAVLGKSADGTLYKLFIPYRNVILQARAVETTLAPEHAATEISGISASRAGDTVEIRFRSSKPNRPVLLFRSNRPIRTESDLLEASALGTLTGNQELYVDYPLGGIPYYYAAFDADMARAGSYPMVPDENVLTSPVSVPITRLQVRKNTPSSRITPLPYLLISSTVFSGENLERSFNYTSQPADLDEAILEIWKNISKKTGSNESVFQAKPVLLSFEQAESLQGEEQRLAGIVRDAFGSPNSSAQNWKSVEEDLKAFLNVRHSDSVKDRAEFYLGQVQFFRGDYHNSLFNFLLSGDSLYTESREWIEHIYPYLEKES